MNKTHTEEFTIDCTSHSNSQNILATATSPSNQVEMILSLINYDKSLKISNNISHIVIDLSDTLSKYQVIGLGNWSNINISRFKCSALKLLNEGLGVESFMEILAGLTNNTMNKIIHKKTRELNQCTFTPGETRITNDLQKAAKILSETAHCSPELYEILINGNLLKQDTIINAPMLKGDDFYRTDLLFKEIKLRSKNNSKTKLYINDPDSILTYDASLSALFSNFIQECSGTEAITFRYVSHGNSYTKNLEKTPFFKHFGTRLNHLESKNTNLNSETYRSTRVDMLRKDRENKRLITNKGLQAKSCIRIIKFLNAEH